MCILYLQLLKVFLYPLFIVFVGIYGLLFSVLLRLLLLLLLHAFLCVVEIPALIPIGLLAFFLILNTIVLIVEELELIDVVLVKFKHLLRILLSYLSIVWVSHFGLLTRGGPLVVLEL